MQNAIASSNYLNFPGIPAKFHENFSEKKSNFVESLRTFEITESACAWSCFILLETICIAWRVRDNFSNMTELRVYSWHFSGTIAKSEFISWRAVGKMGTRPNSRVRRSRISKLGRTPEFTQCWSSSIFSCRCCKNFLSPLPRWIPDTGQRYHFLIPLARGITFLSLWPER